MEAGMVETVYGTTDEGHVMSEKVQSLASSVYKEFERMIKKYDEDVVKELMPLVVGILESLDQAYAEKQESEVELELLRDDNEQLLTQYEREKQLRRGAEQKYLEVEDVVEGEKKILEEKVESLESIVRMLELKSKNAADHVSRLEDKEAEMKKEYTKLHERYTELFKTHMDYMERAKMLMGPDRIGDLANSPRTRGGFQLPNLRPVSMIYGSSVETPLKSAGTPDFDMTSPNRSQDSNVSLKNELKDLDSPEPSDGAGKAAGDSKPTSDKSQLTDTINVRESATGTKVKEGTKNAKARASEMSNNTQPRESRSGPEANSHADSGQTSQSNPENAASQSNIETIASVPSATETKSIGRLSSTDSEVVLRKTTDKSDACQTLAASGKAVETNSGHVQSFMESGDFLESVEVHVPTLPISAVDKTIADIVASTPELEEMEESLSTSTPNSNRVSRRNNDSLFDELTPDVIGDVDFGADITGKEVHPGEYASSDDGEQGGELVGMGKEVENLILENTELLATKNALNIVKDDLIAKVDELTSEQEILREEITSLQTVKSRLQLRITQLEEDLKKTKEELEKRSQESQAEGEDDVPMAQRKRFTRVEMARVLMERNQYKERLMELQEAVRWTEMIRASREHPELVPKKKSTIWSFFGSLVSSSPPEPPPPPAPSFSNLFSSSNKPHKKQPQQLPMATVKYNAPTTNVRPVGDPNKKKRDSYNLGEKAKAYDFLHDEVSAEKTRREREKERREQYKQVRAHVKKDDGRMQAYGWSLPAKFTPQLPREQPSKSHVPVPVPVYCRPLLDKENGLKIWCAAGVNLTGGRTKDGGSIVGASVFYSNPTEETIDNKNLPNDEVEKLDRELKEHEKNVQQSENEQMSSFVWICTSTNSYSRVTVIDANNPGDLLESFRVTSSHILSIASVPGAMESDYPRKEIPEWQKENISLKQPATSNETQANNRGDEAGIGGITFVKCATGPSSQNGSTTASPVGSPPNSRESSPIAKANMAKMSAAVQALSEDGDSNRNAPSDNTGDNSGDSEKSEEDPLGVTGATILKATGSPPSSGATTPNSSSSFEQSEKRMLSEPSELVKDGINSPSANDLQTEEIEKMSSVLPTMWMGCQSGSLYVHSSVAQWKRCLHSVKLGEAVLSIVHIKGRVMVGLADGTIAFFHRASDGQWDLRNYHILDFGRPRQSIRCMTIVASKHVWCGYKNIIHVIDPEHMSIVNTFDAHPRKESQVRQLSWIGDGVWVSIRLDSTLRLYHAYTHQHLQDVDIEPYVSKMLGTGKLGFSFVRITAMLIACKRLWIGTGNGVIISVPLSESNKQQITSGVTSGRPGGVIRVYSDNKNDSVTPGSFIPYCSMAQAQLSFHGHRDAVKFFSAVPGAPSKGVSAASDDTVSNASSKPKLLEATPAPSTQTKLVISGGEGYIDFRIGDGDDEERLLPDDEEKKNVLNKTDRSHLIVWQVTSLD